MNNIAIPIIAVSVVALLLLRQWMTLRRAKRYEGRSAPDTASVDSDSPHVARVYFFHAHHCAPCRSIAPLVERLHIDHPNLSAVEVTMHPELAHDFGIAATPSFVVVSDGRIQEVKLGAVSETWLLRRLAG